MHRRLAFVLLPALGACALLNPPPPAGSGGKAQAQGEDAAIASALQQLNSKKAEYTIGGADLLEITVYQQPDLDRKLRVSQNGTISFPLAGLVKVGGLSTADAGALLADRLKDYIVNPQVTIFIREYGNKKVFVLGEVSKPGSFELPTEAKLTVLEAVSLAGGFTNIAAPDRTKVIRRVDGKSQSISIEVSAVTKRGQKEKDIALEPGDVVFVPQSYF
jgi:polysaccharide export outer membrane protein